MYNDRHFLFCLVALGCFGQLSAVRQLAGRHLTAVQQLVTLLALGNLGTTSAANELAPQGYHPTSKKAKDKRVHVSINKSLNHSMHQYSLNDIIYKYSSFPSFDQIRKLRKVSFRFSIRNSET